MAGNSALPFLAATNINNAITALISDGFSVGATNESNASGTNNMRYVA